MANPTTYPIPFSGLSTQPPGVYLLQVVPGSIEKEWKKVFPQRMTKSLAVGQVSLAFIAFVSQVVIISTTYSAMANALYSGIWCGIFFGIAGGIGLVAATKPGKCVIISFMVMSIIASIMAVPMLSFSAGGLVETRSCLETEDGPYARYYCGRDPFTTAVFDAILCFVAVCEGIIAITSSVVCCRAVCCGRNKFPGSSAMFIAQPAPNGATGRSNHLPTELPVQQMGAAAVPHRDSSSQMDYSPPPAYQEKENSSAPMAAV